MNIIREKYLKKIRPYYNKQLIKAITGQRRVGKSFMLQQIRNELLSLHPKANILYIDKEKYEFEFITNHKELIAWVKQNSVKHANYLFIDEVQEIEEFEKALRSLLSDGMYDIYCSGSNSNVFSGELATFLSGRQIEVRIHSLSYQEFIHFHKLKDDKNALSLFMKYGGLPYLINLPKNDEIVYDYLKNIYATILYRDVISRHQIRDNAFLENLLLFLADNTGCIVSANKIADYLKSQRNSKTVSVVINYLHYLEQAYFVNGVKRKEISGKKIFETGEKYYFEDIGLRNAIGGFKPDDIAKVLENIVYNHLSYLGYKVFVGKEGEKEIDFIAEKNGETVYFQVAYLLKNNDVVNREFGNLQQLKDNYPKYVITMDDLPLITSFRGIKQIHLLKFLNSNEF
ncbi:MAG: ATP-binding protein [Bacteroidales bacterium]|jgi:hypothetical protein